MIDTVLIFSSENVEGTSVFNQTQGHFSVHPYVAPYQLSEHNYPQVNMQMTNACGFKKMFICLAISEATV